MKNLSQIGLLLLAMMVAFTGCDAAKDAANKAKDGVGDMAGMDLGGFDMAAMKDKLAGIKDKFSNVTEENVDGLTSDLNDVSGDLEEVDAEKLPAPAKTAISGMLTKFKDTVQTAMDGISDESILAKLKPSVEGLMEKINAFM